MIGIIPARGGSKGVPGKNIKLLSGYPLIAYSIIAGRLAKNIERVIVSTDSEEIAELSRKYGAEVPFLRPAEFARDNSPDIEFINHAFDWFEENEGKAPEMMVHLRPTTPLRDPEVIDSAIEIIRGNKYATSLRSAHELPESPYKMFKMEDGYLRGFFPDDPRPEYYNLPRQTFPKAYMPNGYVDIIVKETVRKTGSLHGTSMIGFETDNAGELDLPDDFQYIEYKLSKKDYKIHKFLKEQY
ncbi:MAG: acylneuraminate cytidylyltransferase family protein [Deltaproteobacteria bacterium]|nr:acylneuraminate cytidylyltransferase family protein [Deltaproteobacteria bacterium]